MEIIARHQNLLKHTLTKIAKTQSSPSLPPATNNVRVSGGPTGYAVYGMAYPEALACCASSCKLALIC
jgi:hypothetical protein